MAPATQRLRRWDFDRRSESALRTTDRRYWRTVGGAALVGLFFNSACTNPSQPESVPQPAILHTGTCSPLPANDICNGEFLSFAPGTLRITVDWTSSTDSIQVFLSQGRPCAVSQINSGHCTFLAMTPPGTTPKPKILTVPNLLAGTYTLYIGNLGPRSESVSDQVTLTSPGS